MTTSTRSIRRGDLGSPLDVPRLVEEGGREDVLRWYVASADEDALTIELAAAAEGLPLKPWPPRSDSPGTGRVAAVSLVPTGIGCSIGGFAADAGPATKLLSACVDRLVTNPNAVNGSDFVALQESVVYVEGSVLDEFVGGRFDLTIPRANRVGVVLEREDDWKVDHALNVVNAVRAVHGVDIVDVVVTDAPARTHCHRTAAGAFGGVVDDPQPLVDACGRAVAAGATAIALATRIRDLPRSTYAEHLRGEAPNPVGGAEAVLSHLVAREFGLPAAHAPLVNFRDYDELEPVVDPRAAAEFVSTSGLASILIGLHRAPQFSQRELPASERLSPRDVIALVAPASAIGGPAVFHAAARGIPIVAVRGNETILDVTGEALGLEVVEVDDYLAAAGVLVALREGVALSSVKRPLPTTAATRLEVAEAWEPIA